MANRVESEEVKEVIDTEVEDVTSFITTANILVTKILADAGLEDAHLAEIEKYLAAHFVAIRDPRAVSEKIGDAEVKYQTGSLSYQNLSKATPGLNETIYGKQVMLLDTTGLMRQKLGTISASFEALG